MSEKKHAHFQGKEALEHLLSARIRGYLAEQEVHGTEIPGHLSAAADASKDVALLILLLWIVLDEITVPLFCVFTLGLLLWKVGRSALLGYGRLERLHRLVEEERYEIEHHRDQEREELTALYEAKGFSGKLLHEVIDTLMADDHRCLQIMLEEELGLHFESFEHPMKQALGAGVGVLGSSLVLSFALFYLSSPLLFVVGALLVFVAAGTIAQLLKNRLIPSILWQVSLFFFTLLVTYFTWTLLS